MKREKWIDILRGIAILAVVTDHLFMLYPEFRINLLWMHMYFSIAWFVYLSGYTNTLSAQRSKIWTFPNSYFHYYAKRSPILLQYFFASLLIFLLESNFRWNRLVWVDFFNKLLNFSSQLTYYFINLIIQLYFIFPLLFHLLKLSTMRWKKILLSMIVFFLAFIILPPKSPIWPFSPAGRLFGSVYFAAFFLGMLVAEKTIKLNKFISVLSVLCFAIFEFYFFYSRGNFLNKVPNFLLIGWSISMLLFVNLLLDIFKISKLSILSPISFLGKHSLFIYFFHLYILGYSLKYKFANPIIKFIIIYFMALFIPVVLEMFYRRLGRLNKIASTN